MTLAATGLLALAGVARRGARSQVVPEAVRREAESQSKAFRQAVATWTRGMTNEQISGEDRWLGLREAELHELFGERLAGIGTYRVAIFSNDPRYVIKLAMCLSDNLDEAAAWADAGPQTRALLVPVVACDPEGHWLIMERVEVYGGKQTPEEWGLLRQRADDLDKIGLLDLHPDNFSADFRLLDYAEPVNLKGSPARRGARSLPPAYEPTQSAPSRGTWDRTGAEPRWSQAHDVLVRDALSDWKGDTAMMVLHMQDEEAGVAMPSSGSGKIARARAVALLWEIEHKAKPAPPCFGVPERRPRGGGLGLARGARQRAGLPGMAARSTRAPRGRLDFGFRITWEKTRSESGSRDFRLDLREEAQRRAGRFLRASARFTRGEEGEKDESPWPPRWCLWMENERSVIFR